jgi:hypothetical protein
VRTTAERSFTPTVALSQGGCRTLDLSGIERSTRWPCAVRRGERPGAPQREHPALCGKSNPSCPSPLSHPSPVPSAASLRPSRQAVRWAKSRRLTYCFDRFAMRTLGSLAAVPERPVVRNAMQIGTHVDGVLRTTVACGSRANRFSPRSAATESRAPSFGARPLHGVFATAGSCARFAAIKADRSSRTSERVRS